MYIISRLSVACLTFASLLSGCSSAPTQVNANIPLVSGNTIQLADTLITPIPKGNIEPGQVIRIADTDFTVGSSYMAASGLSCLQLQSTGHHHQYRSLCKQNGEWRLLKPLLQSNESIN